MFAGSLGAGDDALAERAALADDPGPRPSGAFERSAGAGLGRRALAAVGGRALAAAGARALADAGGEGGAP
ncbi:MAG TPA: hypothetical protein VG937_35130 [Polyangiaceae bacterium]|nr:hypothetical protein [Polyangiaceae bacterium]